MTQLKGAAKPALRIAPLVALAILLAASATASAQQHYQVAPGELEELLQETRLPSQLKLPRVAITDPRQTAADAPEEAHTIKQFYVRYFTENAPQVKTPPIRVPNARLPGLPPAPDVTPDIPDAPTLPAPVALPATHADATDTQPRQALGKGQDVANGPLPRAHDTAPYHRASTPTPAQTPHANPDTPTAAPTATTSAETPTDLPGASDTDARTQSLVRAAIANPTASVLTLLAAGLLAPVAYAVATNATLARIATTMYTRLRRDALLLNGKRDAIYKAISQKPGITFTELLDTTQLSVGVLTHHLRHLAASGLITRREAGRFCAFFVADARPTPGRALLLDGTRASIARAIAEAPATQRALVERTSLSQRLLSYHLGALTKAGLVTPEGPLPRVYKPTAELFRHLRDFRSENRA